jgi:hypothetical protein
MMLAKSMLPHPAHSRCAHCVDRIIAVGEFVRLEDRRVHQRSDAREVAALCKERHEVIIPSQPQKKSGLCNNGASYNR